MSPNIDNDSGRPAHLVQVRQALEGSSPEALPHQELLGTSLLRLSSTSHGEGARKIQLQQTSSQQGEDLTQAVWGEPQPWLRKPALF